MAPQLGEPPSLEEQTKFDMISKHGHQDLVQAVAFNSYGDRCATGSVDGKIRVFNRHRDGVWRLCDNWGAHAGEILELQWLPPTIYPNLVASLGIEGRFKLWAEDPSAAPGRRFSQRAAKAAYETRSPRAPYRSFALKHVESTRHTFLALLAADGTLTLSENETPENLAEYGRVDEATVCTRPGRGEETAFRVRFDPSPDPCYRALRAGVAPDALGLVVAAMDAVRIYRTRDVTTTAYGIAGAAKELYLAAEITGHRGLVRDVAWAPGNFRGYDIIATACQDGFVRVVRLDAPDDPDDGRSWSAAHLAKGHYHKDHHHHHHHTGSTTTTTTTTTSAAAAATITASSSSSSATAAAASAASAAAASSGIRAELEKTGGGVGGTNGDRRWTGLPGQIKHTVRELCRLDSHRTPVWKVGFDDDGQILGSVGDDGKLMCYRQTPDGAWAKSSELAMMRVKMTAP